MKRQINLNSPAGNVFILMGTIAGLMQDEGFSDEQLRAFNKACFEKHSYAEIVQECKVQLELINKVSIDQYEIIETETYRIQ